MFRPSIQKIAEITKGELLNVANVEEVIKAYSIDSRTIKTCELFVPLLGENTDGHNFVDVDMMNKNVISFWSRNKPLPSFPMPLILVDDPLIALQELAIYHINQVSPKVIAITGSNGKTTTKDICSSIMRTKYRTHATPGNYNSLIGLPLCLLDMPEDTEVVVLEMGIETYGELDIMTKIAKPDVAIITNIGEAHYLVFKSRENIAKAKIEMAWNLDENSTLIYNGDEPLIEKELAFLDSNFKTIKFGFNEENDFIPRLDNMDANSLDFSLTKPELTNLRLNSFGKKQMLNATASIAAGRLMGIEDNLIREALLNVSFTKMRNELIDMGGWVLINDAYNSNPSALSSAIDTLSSLDASVRIAIIGDMLGLAEKSEEYHRDISNLIDPSKIDYVFTFGECAKYISEELSIKYNSEKYKTFDSKEELAHYAKQYIKKDALVLLKASRYFMFESFIELLK